MTCVRNLFRLSLLALIFCGGGTISPSIAHAETLTVSSDGVHVQSETLASGADYSIQASGAVNFWEPNTNLADAAWQQVVQNGTTWVEDITQPLGTTTGLYINDQQVDWLGTTDGTTFTGDTFSPSHVYEYDIVGTGQPADFYFYDIYYPDNVGSFQVTVTGVPEPSTLALLGVGVVALLGCAWRRRKKAA